MTTIADVRLDDDGLRALAGRLKKALRRRRLDQSGVIELPGDHHDLVVEMLRGEGYEVVQGGG